MKFAAKLILGMSLLSCASAALAVPPDAPVINVGVTDVRQLEFNWTPVTRVGWYELWFRSAPGAPWVKFKETSPQHAIFRIGVAVHLLDWPAARYFVKACNPSGCTASNVVGVDGLQREAIGFFKPLAQPDDEGVTYGGNPALSADGKTLVTVDNERVTATTRTTVLYVYRKKTPSSGWRLEARLKPSVRGTTSSPYISDQLAISGDGNLIAYGAWIEDAAIPPPNLETGAVYLFRRSGSTWTQSQRIPGARWSDEIGYNVKLDDAGQTLLATHFVVDNEIQDAVDIYRVDGSSNQFTYRDTLRVPVVNGTPANCSLGLALSGDGNTIFRSCLTSSSSRYFVQVIDAHTLMETGLVDGGSGDGVESSYDGTHIIVQNEADAVAFDLTSSGWVMSGILGSFGGVPYNSRRHIALSRDGKIAALGSPSDIALGRGPIFPPYQTADHATGGVIIHERKASGWVLRRLVKPDTDNDGWFGYSVALGDNGKVLAVSAPLDPSAATGINGDRDDASATNRGAVWLY